jgi:hypothetical protein
MACTDAGAVVALNVFVEQKQVAPQKSADAGVQRCHKEKEGCWQKTVVRSRTKLPRSEFTQL